MVKKTGADQVMPQERLAVPFDPFNQVFLAIVMRDECDVLNFFSGLFSFSEYSASKRWN